MTGLTAAVDRRRGRGQSGITLLELLLVLLLTAMVLGPLTAWWIMALRQQPVIQGNSLQVASAAILARYLPRDLAVAGAAANDPSLTATSGFTFDDCLGGAGAGGQVRLVLVRGGTTRLTKIVYSERTADGLTSIWRRTCDVETGKGTTSAKVMKDVEPGASAECTTGSDGTLCRQVEFRVTPTGQDPIVVRGVRRVDAATVAAQVGGIRSPIAKITVASQSTERPYQVEFSAETSSDPDGRILCYQWVFTTVAEGRGDPRPEYVTVEVPDPGRDPSAGSACPDRVTPTPETTGDSGPSGDLRRQLRSLPSSGVYFVELIVTDDDGTSSTTYKRFEIEPRDPIPDLRVSPVAGGTGTAGSTLFEFAANWTEDGVEQGTRHPDGQIQEYRWMLAANGYAFESTVSSAAPWYVALPQDLAGEVAVSLTVVDDIGRSATKEGILQLGAAAPEQYLSPDTLWPLGSHPPVANVRLGGSTGTAGGAQVVWDPAESVDRYIVELDPGCGASILRAVEPTAEPSAPILPTRCVAPSVVRARVAAELDGQLSPWSEWVTVAVQVHLTEWPAVGGGETAAAGEQGG